MAIIVIFLLAFHKQVFMISRMAIMFNGGKVKEIREKKGFSQRVLAERTGLSLTTIGYYEINMREPKATQLKRLADALGVKMEDFLK